MEKPITPLGNLDFLISNWRKLKYSEKEDVVASCSIIFAREFPSRSFIVNLSRKLTHINNRLARSPKGGILLNRPCGGKEEPLDVLLGRKARIEEALIDLFKRLKKKGGNPLYE